MTVLLVEDEATIRRLAARVLRGRGHEVIEAADAEACLREFDALGGEIDLLVSDVVMPGMGGVELAECLRARRPGLRVIMMSGYATENIWHRGHDEATAFLPKPFSPTDLLRVLADLCGG